MHKSCKHVFIRNKVSRSSSQILETQFTTADHYQTVVTCLQTSTCIICYLNAQVSIGEAWWLQRHLVTPEFSQPLPLEPATKHWAWLKGKQAYESLLANATQTYPWYKEQCVREKSIR